MNVQRGKDMKIKNFTLGMMGTNCYVVQNEESKGCLIVDPGAKSEALSAYIRENGLSPEAILLTHGHFDHIMGIDSLRREYPVSVYADRKEQYVLADPNLNLSAAYGGGYSFGDAEYVEDGQILSLAGLEIRVIETPGHTAGGCCYYIASEGVLFSGDTLFHSSVGRTDFPTGSMGTLIRSIKEKLLVLPGDTMVYPGHMEQTTIAYEAENNPFL